MNVMRPLPIDSIVNIGSLQKIQDDFATVTGMGFITVDYKGNPVTEASGFKRFCQLCREHDELSTICNQCDAHGGLNAAINGKPHIYKCHADIVDFAIPIVFEDNYYGALLGGQVKTENMGPGLDNVTSKSLIWKDDKEMVKAYGQVPAYSYERIQAVISILSANLRRILEMNYVDMAIEEMEKLQMELSEEKEKRAAIEYANSLFPVKTKTELIFSNLNTIARMSFVEGAKETEKALYILSDLLRYQYDAVDAPISKIGSEVRYAENYLKLQKLKYEDKLVYNIDVSESLYDVVCPYFLIQPIVQNCVEYVVESSTEPGVISIGAYMEQKDLIIFIRDNGEGIPASVVDKVLNDRKAQGGEISRYDLYSINRMLIRTYGKKYGLKIENMDGTCIIIRIPT